MQRYQNKVIVGVILIQEDKVLVERRAHTGWEDGKYGLIVGHLEKGETLKEAMIREAKEELGIQLQEEQLEFVTCMHFSQEEYLNIYFTTTHYEGIPGIKEPHKCDEIKWLPINSLPTNLLEQDKQAIESFLKQIHYQEYHNKGEMLL